MKTARLTADLLVRRGEARALADTYGTAFLDPVPSVTREPVREERARPSPSRAKPARISCTLGPDDHRRLKIAAARLGRSASALVREALDRLFADLAADCACLAEPGTTRRPSACCRENG